MKTGAAPGSAGFAAGEAAADACSRFPGTVGVVSHSLLSFQAARPAPEACGEDVSVGRSEQRDDNTGETAAQ